LQGEAQECWILKEGFQVGKSEKAAERVAKP
jgi:hypothetical protein